MKKSNTAVLHFVFVIVIEEKSPMFIVIYLHLEDAIAESVMVCFYLFKILVRAHEWSQRNMHL